MGKEKIVATPVPVVAEPVYSHPEGVNTFLSELEENEGPELRVLVENCLLEDPASSEKIIDDFVQQFYHEKNRVSTNTINEAEAFARKIETTDPNLAKKIAFFLVKLRSQLKNQNGITEESYKQEFAIKFSK